MVSLTFGEQVKILLSRNNMTIKELAEMIEKRTGTKMSRQNLTQRLGRDNFQEQDMRTIAEILGCPFQLNILDTQDRPEGALTGQTIESVKQKINKVPNKKCENVEVLSDTEREVTIGELAELFDEVNVIIPINDDLKEASQDIPLIEEAQEANELEVDSKPDLKTEAAEELPARDVETKSTPVLNIKKQLQAVQHQLKDKVVKKEKEVKEVVGDVNPYTGREYESNSVRMHAKRIGYVQVYDKVEHKWTDMTEWAFLGYQERKKALLGKGYEPPIYLD